MNPGRFMVRSEPLEHFYFEHSSISFVLQARCVPLTQCQLICMLVGHGTLERKLLDEDEA